ncbi:MAG: hypothetical protein ACOVNU_11655 [Candidatus Kapaibacteriota bacterium]
MEKETLEETLKEAKDFIISQKGNPNVPLPQEHIQPLKHGFIKGENSQKKRLSEIQIIQLIQFLCINKEFNEYSSVGKKTAKYFLNQFKNNQ